MADDKPLTNDDIEMLLHEVTRLLVEARSRPGDLSPQHREALQIAMTGPLAALMRLEKQATGQSET